MSDYYENRVVEKSMKSLCVLEKWRNQCMYHFSFKILLKKSLLNKILFYYFGGDTCFEFNTSKQGLQNERGLYNKFKSLGRFTIFENYVNYLWICEKKDSTYLREYSQRNIIATQNQQSKNSKLLYIEIMKRNYNKNFKVQLNYCCALPSP